MRALLELPKNGVVNEGFGYVVAPGAYLFAYGAAQFFECGFLLRGFGIRVARWRIAGRFFVVRRIDGLRFCRRRFGVEVWYARILAKRACH